MPSRAVMAGHIQTSQVIDRKSSYDTLCAAQENQRKPVRRLLTAFRWNCVTANRIKRNGPATQDVNRSDPIIFERLKEASCNSTFSIL
jgi:hypothetical protein